MVGRHRGFDGGRNLERLVDTDFAALTGEVLIDVDGGADGGKSADKTLLVSAADAIDESEARVGDD